LFPDQATDLGRGPALIGKVWKRNKQRILED